MKNTTNNCDYCCVHLSTAYIHLCRSLVITSILLGFIGSVLALVGMKCTKLGGSEIVNARITFAAGITYLLSGKRLHLSGLSGMFLLLWTRLRLCFRFLWDVCLQLVRTQGDFWVHGSQLQGQKVNISVQKLSQVKCALDTSCKGVCCGDRFEPGVALFVGWGGSALLLVGGLVYSITAGNQACKSRY